MVEFQSRWSLNGKENNVVFRAMPGEAFQRPESWNWRRDVVLQNEDSGLLKLWLV